MLDPDYSTMSAGIAWNKQAFNIVQQFETQFVEFTEGPELKDGILTMKGRTRNLPDFGKDQEVLVGMYYDPPLLRLQPNQLARTSCYGQGEPILVIRKPAPRGKTYAADVANIEDRMGACPDPYRISRKVRAPSSIEDIEQFHERAKRAVRDADVSMSIRLIQAYRWITSGSEFYIVADLSEELKDPGVYTLFMEAVGGAGRSHSIAEKSFFHDVRPPRYYAREQ